MTPRRPLALALAAAGAAASAAACTDVQPPPVATEGATVDSADQVLYGVRAALVGGGVRRGELFADTVFMFDQSTRMELRGVRANFFTQAGAADGTLTSRTGTYNTRSGIMQARGDVVVQSQDGRRLQSPELRFLVNQNEIRSDSSFVLTRPGDRLTGVGFVSDPNLQNVQVFRATGATGGSVTIPGQ